MTFRIRTSIFLAWVGASVWVAPAVGQAPSLREHVRAVDSPGKGRVGVSVVDLSTGRTLFAHRQREPFLPASNQKLLTSAFALVRLGPAGNFTTSIYAAGKDVIVTGQFDPLLGDPVLAEQTGASIYAELDRWAQAVRQNVGETIRGDLVLAVVGDVKNMHPPDWSAAHRARWYGAPVASLNFHDNCYDVTFVREGETVLPRVTPVSRFCRVINQARFDPAGRHLWRLQPAEDDSSVTITGNVRTATNEPLSVPVSNPPAVLGRVLADRLVQAGVKIAGKLRLVPAERVNLSGAKRLAETQTPLSGVLRRANQRSLNLAGECLLLRAGDGTWPGSTRCMRETLVEHFGLDPQTLAVRDGSGLSRGNRVTPADMTKLLRALAISKYGPAMLASLSRSGVNGSLRRRLGGEPYFGRVAAKTGTLAGVRALSGYVLDAGGTPRFAFAIFANGLHSREYAGAKRMQDRICKTLIDQCP